MLQLTIAELTDTSTREAERKSGDLAPQTQPCMTTPHAWKPVCVATGTDTGVVALRLPDAKRVRRLRHALDEDFQVLSRERWDLMEETTSDDRPGNGVELQR